MLNHIQIQIQQLFLLRPVQSDRWRITEVSQDVFHSRRPVRLLADSRNRLSPAVSESTSNIWHCFCSLVTFVFCWLQFCTLYSVLSVVTIEAVSRCRYDNLWSVQRPGQIDPLHSPLNVCKVGLCVCTNDVLQLLLHSESKKLCDYTFVHNFDKCWAIFKIFSLSYSPWHLQQNLCYISYHGLKVLLHYLTKHVQDRNLRNSAARNICLMFTHLTNMIGKIK